MEKEYVYLIKMGRYFNNKEKTHTTYDCPKKKKIVPILEDIIKKNKS